MIIFSSTIKFDKPKSKVRQLLRDKSFSETENPRFYVFPFSFFSKAFYRDVKNSWAKIFMGKISDSNFELEVGSAIFLNNHKLPLSITGSITDNSMKINYSIPYYFLIGILILNIFLFVAKEMFNYEAIAIFINAFSLIIYIIKVYRIQKVFNKICKND